MARRLYPTEKKNMSILSLTVIRLRRVTLRSAVVAIFGGLLISACSTVGFSKTAPPVSSTCHSAQQCAVPVEVDCGPSPCVIRISSQFTNVDANGFDVVWQIVPKAGQSYTVRNPGGVSFKVAEGQRLFRCQTRNERRKVPMSQQRQEWQAIRIWHRTGWLPARELSRSLDREPMMGFVG